MLMIKLEKEYKLQELVLFLIEDPESIENYCVYTAEEDPEATSGLTCYIDSYPEINDVGEEVYSEFVIKQSLELFISGQQLVDIIDNTLYQKKDADIDDYLKNINYYLEYDTFFDFVWTKNKEQPNTHNQKPTVNQPHNLLKTRDKQ